jgi:predicted nucleic acid-binding protein
VIIVDTSVWIDHLRTANPALLAAIAEGVVLHHPFVTAELALGNLPDRRRFCAMLGGLPQIEPVGTAQLLDFVVSRELWATGVGMVDAHLLASAADRPNVTIWASDKRLAAQAERLGLSHGKD